MTLLPYLPGILHTCIRNPMTPRSSQRARAREIYRDMAAPSLTLPRKRGREQSEQAARSEPDPPSQSFGAASLTEKVRALYENSAVPVREIARIAGVTERTLYRYVEKGDWKRRYVCAARDEAVASANRGRRWQVSPERQILDGRADVAPAKGAGGRFIRREDIGKPFAKGLKAIDPSGRARAVAACGKASRLSRRAQAKALAESRCAAGLDAIDATNLALAALNQFRRDFTTPAAMPRLRPRLPHEWPREEPKQKGRKKAVLPASLFDAGERAHLRTAEAALRVWQAFVPAISAKPAAAASPSPAPSLSLPPPVPDP
ncbi:MAG: hypothetical protein NTZ72_19020, partial [Afipia sp.]|nr:hypothetical protein [Afipia sp.]